MAWSSNLFDLDWKPLPWRMAGSMAETPNGVWSVHERTIAGVYGWQAKLKNDWKPDTDSYLDNYFATESEAKLACEAEERKMNNAG